MDVTVIWAAIIALGVFTYVVLDGFHLGIGIVFPFFRDEHDRDRMTNTVAPVWNGNKAWLVPGGAALFAVLPVLYSPLLSTLYLPLAFMLACLILRGVSIRNRAKADRTKPLWDRAFTGGSAGAAFFQGIALGAFVQGISVDTGTHASIATGWLTPFNLFAGFGVVATYALLGSCWLFARTDANLQRRLHRLIWPLTMVLLGFVVLVSVWTPLAHASIATRWFDARLFLRLTPVPLLVLVCGYWMHRAIRARHRSTPFFAALGLVALGYLGILVSVWPYATAHSVTLRHTAVPHSSEMFALSGALVMLPVVMSYTTLGCRALRGKVRHGGTGRYL
ncbi:cytochrome d ubiquinol oxidase subunit II [Paraburkholderia dinghuensis]|uniref:Cytochrome d ubiquinol oxidase subunit II n=1 Tax=Paraburkholderia dinghuensis TaxID=2305225 RepID=A0A3N6Q1L1_9BURK|nr:cytochrome d ubiquinol oxidase subunit II [Paraburkholderia dinghuensis]RQH08890.1 cytochrome d ubiquinol oxidase subunit II [Paraburkholderia dinghuensis]